MRNSTSVTPWWIVSLAVAAMLLGACADGDTRLNAFLIRIQDSRPAVRSEAAADAGPMGADAIVPLADLMAGEDPDVTAAASDAMREIVRYAAEPTAPGPDRRAVASELADLLDDDRPDAVRTEALRLLPQVGDRRVVGPISHLFGDPDLRDAALACLRQIPGKTATRALRAELELAPADFKPKIEAALRERGEFQCNTTLRFPTTAAAPVSEHPDPAELAHPPPSG